MAEAGTLDRLAELAGIESDYWDIWGNHHFVSEDSKRAILNALGIHAADDAAASASIKDLEEEPWRRPLLSVSVVHEGKRPIIPLTLAADGVPAQLTCEVMEEGGGRHEFVFRPGDAAVIATRVIDGQELQQRPLEIPVDLPLGYHDVRLVANAIEISRMRLIVAPERCYLPESLAKGTKQWGIAAHLYTLRRERDWGIGDFSNLNRLVEVSANLGAALIGLNPLHALFPQDPKRASPYFPSSRLFLNPVYLDVEAIPEFAECADAQKIMASVQRDLEAARSASFVDYPMVVALKQEVLQALYECFRRNHPPGRRIDARFEEFTRFCEQEGEPLRRFAVFEALSERFKGSPWLEWPDAYQDPNSLEVATFAEAHRDRIQFFQYLQWQADVQLADAQRRARESGLQIGLYRDLAVGAAPDGAESWSSQDVVVQQATVGCPPDPFNMLGQDWGIPPLHPHVLRRKAYELFIEIVRANMRHAGALRIDHVMGLKHLFWIPKGGAPASGAYIQYPFEDLLAVLALESHRQRCLVIGEDLGTVPEGFRERMAAANVLSYRVLYFEKDGDRFKRPSEYPSLALACVTTHDLATLTGFWTSADIDLKQQLDQYPSEKAEQNERAGRSHDCRLLLNALADEGLIPEGLQTEDPEKTPMSPPLAAALHEYLSRSPVSLLLVQIDDLMQEREQINLPGTDAERPNWRRRLGMSVDHLATAPVTQALQDALTDRRR